MNRNGGIPILDRLIDLEKRALASKDARIQHEKILTFIEALRLYGTRIGQPHVKHIEGDI